MWIAMLIAWVRILVLTTHSFVTRVSDYQSGTFQVIRVKRREVEVLVCLL